MTEICHHNYHSWEYMYLMHCNTQILLISTQKGKIIFKYNYCQQMIRLKQWAGRPEGGGGRLLLEVHSTSNKIKKEENARWKDSF